VRTFTTTTTITSHANCPHTCVGCTSPWSCWSLVLLAAKPFAAAYHHHHKHTCCVCMTDLPQAGHHIMSVTKHSEITANMKWKRHLPPSIQPEITTKQGKKPNAGVPPHEVWKPPAWDATPHCGHFKHHCPMWLYCCWACPQGPVLRPRGFADRPHLWHCHLGKRPAPHPPLLGSSQVLCWTPCLQVPTPISQTMLLLAMGYCCQTHQLARWRIPVLQQHFTVLAATHHTAVEHAAKSTSLQSDALPRPDPATQPTQSAAERIS